MKWLAVLLAALCLAAASGCGDQPSKESAGGSSGASSPAGPSSPADSGSGATGGTSSTTAGGSGGGVTTSTESAPEKPAKVAEKDYKKTPSGLKYAILKPGKGPEAKSGQKVAMHYTGWTANGAKFDSSFDHPGKEPLEFTIDGADPFDVIEGWDEGVKGMKVGEKRQLVIPYPLGYGERGNPAAGIPSKATLIFDVQLVKFVR